MPTWTSPRTAPIFDFLMNQGQACGSGTRIIVAATGLKQSTLGRELRPHALDECTEEQFVHVDPADRLDRQAYPLLLSAAPG